MLTLVTFGDSVLDCGSYNSAGITPGQLLVANDDQRFPEFRGRDLQSLGLARLEHRAQDGATVADLAPQLEGLFVDGPAVALLSIGGNDLLMGAASGVPADTASFRRQLTSFLEALPIRPVFVATIYDPSFGHDQERVLGIDPGPVRAIHRAFNATLTDAGRRAGQVVDVHAHFMGGDRDWFVQSIEPSMVGASEVRRCFWPAVSEFAAANLASL